MPSSTSEFAQLMNQYGDQLEIGEEARKGKLEDLCHGGQEFSGYLWISAGLWNPEVGSRVRGYQTRWFQVRSAGSCSACRFVV